MTTSAAVSHAYGLDTSAMHSSQVPEQTPRVQRNRVKDIVAQFNQEAKKRDTLQRHHSYDQTDNSYYTNGYAPLKCSPSPPHINGNSRNIYSLPLSQRSKSELNLTGPPSTSGDGGVTYAQVQVVNGSRNGDANKYKTTVHTVHHPSGVGQRHIGSSKLAKSTGSLHRVQLNEEEEEDDRVLNTLNHKSTANNHSYYRFDDPSSDSYKNSSLGRGHHHVIKKKSNTSYEDDVFESPFTKNGNHIIPLRSSNGYNSVTETSQPVVKTKNVEKWSEKEDLGPNRRKFTEHEKVHLVTMSNDVYDGRKKSPSPISKFIKSGEDYDEDEMNRLRRIRDVTLSPVANGSYSKKTSAMEDSTLQRSRMATPEPLRAPSRSPVAGYYYGQPNKTVTARHHATENVTSNEESHWHRNGRRHSTDSTSSGVLLSSRLVKQANAELNNDFHGHSPPLPPLMTSSWRREDDDDVFKSGRLRPLSPRLRPLSPSSGVSSATSAGRLVGETREEKRHFRKQETTKTTKHETEKSRATPVSRRSRSADRHHRLQIENNENNEPIVTAPRRSASSTARRRLDKHFYDEERMETSGSDAQLYGGSQGSNMSLGSGHNEEHRHHHHQRTLNEKESIMAAHSNTPTSMMKQMNKNSISYENAQRRDSNDAASASSNGRRMWFERLNDDVDDVRLSSATMSRLETKKNRRNHLSDNELSVNTVDRRDVMRRRRNKDVRHADRSHAHQVARSSSFNSRVDNYHSEIENESQASSTASKPKRVNFKSNGKTNGFLSPSHRDSLHREAILRSTSPARAPSIASNDSEMSNRSVILHATAVADIPAPAQYRARSANTSPAPSLNGSADGRSSRGGRQKESRTVQRSFSLLSPWKPRRYKEKSASASSSAYHEEVGTKTAASKKSQESLSHHSSSAERLDSLSPLPSEVPAKTKKKPSGILRRRHSMPKDSRFANFFRRKNKDAKKSK